MIFLRGKGGCLCLQWVGHSESYADCRDRSTTGYISVHRAAEARLAWGVYLVISTRIGAGWHLGYSQESQCFRQLINVSWNTITRSAAVESSNLFQLLSPTCHPWKLLFVGDIFSLPCVFATAHWKASDGSGALGKQIVCFVPVFKSWFPALPLCSCEQGQQSCWL